MNRNTVKQIVNEMIEVAAEGVTAYEHPVCVQALADDIEDGEVRLLIAPRLVKPVVRGMREWALAKRLEIEKAAG